MSYGKLGSTVTIQNSNAVVYTVPENATFASININVVNTSAEAATVSLAISGSETIKADDYIEHSVTIPPKGVLERTSIICNTGENIIVFSNKNGVVVRVHGFEEKIAIDPITQTSGSTFDLNSPVFTGTPTAPTPAISSDNTQLATTAFVKTIVANNSATKLHNHTNATISADGFMSAADKVKLDGIAGTGTDAVTSVAGRSGAVVLTRADVGLSDVDNTADSAKPVSTAQANALALKASITSPALAGTPTAPTAAVGTNTAQLATTAFVQAEIANDAAPIAHVGATGSAHGVVTTAVAGFMSAADKTKLDGIASDSIPAGTVIHTATSNPPTGYIKANGAALSRTVYSNLFTAIGTIFGAGDGSTTFNLPDLRGEFIRGWDDSRGIDAGRAFGSNQAGDNKSHTHTGSSSSAGAHTHSTNMNDRASLVDMGSPVGSFGIPQTTNAPTILYTSSAGAHTHTMNLDSQGSEARPRNIALLACIKY